MIKQFLVFGLFAFSRKVLSIYFLILISLFSDVSSLSCNEGSMMHGMPASLTSHTCKAGVLNCIRIFASKSDKIYRIADANFNQMRRVATPRWLAGVADWTWQEMGVCQVQWGQWGPFSFIAMVQDCLKELFLTWVTTITAPSPPASAALISATRSTGVTAAGRAPPAPSSRAWPAWPSPWLWSRDECLVFSECRCLCAFVFPTRTLLLIKDEKLKCHKSSSGCAARAETLP